MNKDVVVESWFYLYSFAIFTWDFKTGTWLHPSRVPLMGIFLEKLVDNL